MTVPQLVLSVHIYYTHDLFFSKLIEKIEDNHSTKSGFKLTCASDTLGCYLIVVISTSQYTSSSLVSDESLEDGIYAYQLVILVSHCLLMLFYHTYHLKGDSMSLRGLVKIDSVQTQLLKLRNSYRMFACTSLLILNFTFKTGMILTDIRNQLTADVKDILHGFDVLGSSNKRLL